jgi:chemosensory pili system protein ChpA (sensor histidine kinase/response regulator)
VLTDNDQIDLGRATDADPADEAQEESLRWLLEMEMAEPEETLFGLAEEAYQVEGLSAYEAEVAARPLVRGNAASDDLMSYVAEEIVISSDSGDFGGIYSGDAATGSVEEPVDDSSGEKMAVDYSRRAARNGATSSAEVDGTDILGLSDKDDMGEKFLTIRRVKRTETARPSPADSTPAPVDQPATAGAEPATSSEEESVEPGPIEYVPVDLASSVDEVDPVCESEEVAPGDDEEERGELHLSEAPVPGLVAAPGMFPVANEDQPEIAGDASVTDYVTGMAPPVDEEGFDRYLVQGDALAPPTGDPEELVAAVVEGVVPVDPSDDTAIDYHEDFLSLEGMEQGSVASLAAVIADAMEEISDRARALVAARGQAVEALAADVMLGSDPATVTRCQAEGFEPVTAICPELPTALQGLDPEALASIHVRLFDGETNESRNDLFRVESDAAPEAAHVALPGHAEIESVFDDLLVEEAAAPLAPPADCEPGAGFDEELLAGDFDTGFETGETGSDLDIEDVFAEVGRPAQVADEICGLDPVEFAGAAEEADADTGTEVARSSTAPVEEQPAEVALQADGGSNWCVPEGIAFSYTSQSSAEIFADFLDAFIEEGTAEVEKLEDAFGEWEKDPADEAALVPVARTLHTLKGIAKGVGLQRYGTLVHNFETLLEALPRPESGSEAQYFRMVNAWLDAVVRGLDHVQEQRGDIASEFPQQASPVSVDNDAAAGPAQDETAADEVSKPEAVAPAKVADVPAEKQRARKRDQMLADEGAKALAAQQSVRITAEKLDHLLNLTSQSQQLGVRASQSTNKSKRATAELQGRLASVRSQIGAIADRALINVNARSGRITPDLDALEMDQYSELQEAANILREGVEDLADLIELASRQNAMVDALLKQQSSVITSITSAIQAARVVPVSRLMPGLRRIVRTVSTDLDKSVTFKVLNEAGALDRDHYARCQTILEHMVRNALDHGIESAEEREALGKPGTGRITIDVRKAGGDYLIRLADDGRGIDPDAIRESVYRKGLDIDVDKLSDDEVLRLIFHKGFSTASTLSEISGRGVGMDIVMSELQQLGGDIQIRSTVGLGTSFDIRIPANVAVHGALFVTAGDKSYAIPLNGLIAVEQVPVTDFYRAVEKGETLSLFDVECEPAYLATLCEGGSLPDRDTWGVTVPVIIAGSEDRYMAIAIDNVEEALELVVRSLGPQFSGVPGVAGAATTADGEAVVALDLNLLVQHADDDGLSQIAVSRPKETSLLALVVDDSRTQRMVATSQLETVGVETITAENGMVAIDLLNGAHRLPDIVLLDVEMPVQDGIETLREIRKSRRFGHLPVIMVTSRTGAKHRAMAREAGCNGYMGKPFNFPALVEKISELTDHQLNLS